MWSLSIITSYGSLSLLAFGFCSMMYASVWLSEAFRMISKIFDIPSVILFAVWLISVTQIKTTYLVTRMDQHTLKGGT